MVDNILEMRHVSKSYPGVKALDDVDFSVQRGEVHALMGENGAGKSTLMKVLSGVHRADTGEVFFDGKQVTIHNPVDSLKLGISMIFQELSPIPELTITENIYTGVRFPRKMRGIVDWKEAYRLCQEQFDKLGLEYDPKTKMRSLSIADTQMIEIVKAISFDAKLIIMDEPTSALTEREVKKLYSFIKALQQRGITIIIITHKLDEVFQIADAVTVLRDGKYVGTKPIGELTRDAMITMMVGRDIKNNFEEKDYAIGDTVLEVEHLSRGRMVQDISFSIRRGEILGFSGMMGAGRTETVRCIFGLDAAQSGTIRLDGKALKIKHPREAIQNGIMMVTEDRKKDGLVLCRSIFENILLPSTFQHSWHGILQKHKERGLADGVFDQLAIKAPSIHTMTNQLSGGNQQKVIIAKWLLMHPVVLIMDEPTRGIDVGAKSEIYKLLRALAKEGVAIILVSSDMEELLGISDRIAVMSEGRLTGFVEREEFSQEKIMEHATVNTAVGGY